MNRGASFIFNNGDITSLPDFRMLDDDSFVYEKLNQDIHIPVAQLPSWQDFIKVFTRQPHINNEALIFRGHQDPSWRLIPTLLRTYESLNGDQINQIIETFQSALTGINLPELINFDTSDKNKLWALGRHYGLPTPIMDWTYDPLTALYFAFENRANLFSYHAIYIVDTSKIDKKKVYFYNNKPHQNEREEKQNSCYIRVKDNKCLESIVGQDKSSPSYFRKIYVKKSNAQTCLDQLENTYNKSKLSLYPNSIEGVVDYCKTQIPSPYEGKLLIGIEQAVK